MPGGGQHRLDAGGDEHADAAPILGLLVHAQPLSRAEAEEDGR